MNLEHIASYKDGNIIQTTPDHETLKVLEKVKKGYYKILPLQVGIEMKGGRFHAINGGGHRLTDIGFQYFELIIKERKISYYIKHLFESENWDELKTMMKSKID